MIKASFIFVFMVTVSSADEILLRTGEKLTYTKILKVEPDGLKLLVPDGVKKLSIDDMTDASRVKYGIDEAKAEKFREKREVELKAQTEAEADQEQKMTEDRQAAKEKANMTPKTVDAERVKSHWIQQLPKPGSLERDYHAKIERYNNTITMIKMGQFDAQAQEMALSWNISEYERTGQSEQAKGTRVDLVAVRKKIAEQTQLEERQRAAAQNLAIEQAKTEVERQKIWAIERQTNSLNDVKRELSALNMNLNFR